MAAFVDLHVRRTSMILKKKNYSNWKPVEEDAVLVESIQKNAEEVFGGLDLEQEFGPIKTDFDDLDDDPIAASKKTKDVMPPPDPSLFADTSREEDDDDDDDDDIKMQSPPDTPFFREDDEMIEYLAEEGVMPPPPNTPFFSSEDEMLAEDEMPPPPNTPFFSDDSPQESVKTEKEETASTAPINISDLFSQRREEGEKRAAVGASASGEPQGKPNTPFFSGSEEDEGPSSGSSTTEPPPADPSTLRRPKRRKKPSEDKQVSGMQGGFLGIEAFGSSEEEEEDDDYEEEDDLEDEVQDRPLDKEDEFVRARIASGGGEMLFNRDYQSQEALRRRDSSTGYESFREELLQFDRLRRDQIELLMTLKSDEKGPDPFRFQPRIKHPFNMFGAILRLEGLLVDVSNLQYFAWKKISEEYDFSPPREDAIEHASVVRPDVAVRQIFRWEVGFMRSQQIADNYRRVFREVFFAYLDKGIKPTELDVGVGSAQSIGDDMVKSAVAKQEDLIASDVDEDLRPKATMEQVSKFAAETWVEIARTYNLPEPSKDKLRESLGFPPDVAITQVFGWPDNYQLITKMKQLLQRSMDYKLRDFSGVEDNWSKTDNSEEEEYEAKFLASFGTKRRYVNMNPSIKDWVKSLVAEEMSVGLVSNMDRDIVDALMDYTGLDSLIPREKRVTATDGYIREGQPYLGCCLRLERKPDHVAVLDVAPNSIMEAEQIDFPSVGVVGAFPAYDLTAADWIVPDIDMITPMNIRRLFSDRLAKEPETAPQDRKPIRPRKKVMVAFMDPEEEEKAKKEEAAKNAGKEWWVREAEERQAREAEESEYEDDDGRSFYQEPSEDDGYVWEEKFQ